MDQFTKVGETIVALFLTLGFLVFFGPIITMVSLIGRIKLGLIELDLSKHSKFIRFVLGSLGCGVWLAIYVPLVIFLSKAFPTTPTATQVNSTLIPVVAETATMNPIPPSETVTPSMTSTPILVSSPADPSLVLITEVMGNPCGGSPGEPKNEYVELYNSGDQIIDVGGWWITDGEEADKVVSWKQRYSNVQIGNLVRTDITAIPPHGFAVILAGGYPFVEDNPKMPYLFPENTIILTIEQGYLLGDEEYGIEVSNRDVVVIYQGTNSLIDRVISTYGSPTLGSIPTSIRDDGKDGIPLPNPGSQCWVAERVYAVNDDVESNWREADASPGSGSYP